MRQSFFVGLKNHQKSINFFIFTLEAFFFNPTNVAYQIFCSLLLISNAN